MKTNRPSERGQVLILIVLAIVGLIGLTGLAIDGGNAYSDRRHAQTAADTAAMAAALTQIENASDPDNGWQAGVDAGTALAQQNGYASTNPNQEVHIYNCGGDPAPAPVVPCVLPSTEDPKFYLQVTIKSTISTYFAPIVGITHMTNFVQAVAKVVPPEPTTWYNGNALVAIMPDCKPSGWPDDPFTITGGSHTQVFGISGIYVNSTCNPAFTASNNSTLDSPEMCVRGTSDINSATVDPAPTDNCTTYFDFSKYILPPVTDATCTTPGEVTGNKTIGYDAKPGYYANTFPGSYFGAAGTVRLGRGVYCLDDATNALSITASGWNFTTDLNGNGLDNTTSDPLEGVLFYVPHGGVTINSGTIQLSAMETGADYVPLHGYLMYLPPTNSSTLSIEGGGASAVQGTILAPAARVTIAGNSTSSSFNLESQIIGFSVSLSGSGSLQITYNQSTNATTWTTPSLQPYYNK